MPDLLVAAVGSSGHQFIGKTFLKGRAILGRIEGTTFHVPIQENEEDNFYVLVYRDKCHHYHNKCITSLSKIQCDCLECSEVESE